MIVNNFEIRILDGEIVPILCINGLGLDCHVLHILKVYSLIIEFLK